MHLWSALVNSALFVFTLFLPAWKSLEAIESRGSDDDRQWLSYWLVYAVTVMLENMLGSLLKWVPLYLELKMILSAWLVLPQFQGALYTLELYVLPALIAGRDYLRTIPVLQSFLDTAASPSQGPEKQFSTPTSPHKVQSTGRKAFGKSLDGLRKMVKKPDPQYDPSNPFSTPSHDSKLSDGRNGHEEVNGYGLVTADD